MSTNAELSDIPKQQYTEEFLRSFKDRQYEVPEDVKKNEHVYIHAPKPLIHRPRVDRSRSRGARVSEAGNKSFLTAVERQELQRRRKDDRTKEERKKQFDGKENVVPQTAPGSSIAAKIQLKSQAVVPEKEALPKVNDDVAICTESESEQATEDEMTDSEHATARAILQDAQEQQLLLTVPDPDSVGVANKPETRSLIPRGKKAPPPIETDERRLMQRRKQVEFGKVTEGYKNYLKLRPRERRTKHEPQTPNALQKCSKRSWDGQIRKWRQQLHKYDDVDVSHIPDVPQKPAVATPVKEVPREPVVEKTPTRPPVAVPKVTPTISKEERDDLARKRKELDDMKACTPKKVAVPEEVTA
uniref:Histone RNA hairpin-binding protein RNA-binding domain-containing protein n=1 Tax=Eutreptiella gymnastica TaxID=73025 RepID=A0A7S1J603_9EUGL|mmetsp:Transcript_69508/g.122696  ORF Transcript_69508/g.122696 Transcript_69508/m.122696 type:complete len:358 (+) Transcript_69508:121-1194(+)